METELNKLFRLADCHRKAISAEDQTTADKFENQAFELTSEYVIKMVSGNAKAVPAVEPVRSYFAAYLSDVGGSDPSVGIFAYDLEDLVGNLGIITGKNPILACRECGARFVQTQYGFPCCPDCVDKFLASSEN